MQKTLRSSLTSNDVITELTESVSSKDKEQTKEQAKEEVAQILASVADKTIETIREESFLTIDSRPLLGTKGNTWQVPYEQFATVSDLLDDVWISMSDHIPSMQYGLMWIFREARSGRLFNNMGRRWAEMNLRESLDTRGLKSVGIMPGMKLEAISIRNS